MGSAKEGWFVKSERSPSVLDCVGCATHSVCCRAKSSRNCRMRQEARNSRLVRATTGAVLATSNATGVGSSVSQVSARNSYPTSGQNVPFPFISDRLLGVRPRPVAPWTDRLIGWRRGRRSGGGLRGAARRFGVSVTNYTLTCQDCRCSRFQTSTPIPSARPIEPSAVGAVLRGEDTLGRRLPRAGDGKRAVPDAWRGQDPGRGRRRDSRGWWRRAPGTAGMARPSGRCAGTIGFSTNGPGCWPRRRRCWPYLSPDLRARLDRGPAELGASLYPSRVPGVPVAGTVAGDAGLGVVVPAIGRDARGRFAAGPRVAAPGRMPRGRAAERVAAQAEAATLAPWKAGIAQALMARGMVLAGRRAVRAAAVRNDPMGGRGMGGGAAALGGGEQRPYGRPDSGDDDGAVRGARRAVPGVDVRNDPIGGRVMGGGRAAIGGGEQRPYRRSDGGDDDGAVRGARPAMPGVAVRNDPIGGRAAGGGGSCARGR